MNKAIFLDRDGTINIDYGYVHNISDFHFIAGVIESLKSMYDLGYLLIVISNQSGIGRKYYTEEDCNRVFDYMVNFLDENGVKISKYYYCPHVDEDCCDCRKPGLKLFYDAIREFDIDVDKSFAIGDKIRDLTICFETPVKGILLNDTSDNIDVSDCSNIVKRKSMLEALEYIKEMNEVINNEKK